MGPDLFSKKALELEFWVDLPFTDDFRWRLITLSGIGEQREGDAVYFHEDYLLSGTKHHSEAQVTFPPDSEGPIELYVAIATGSALEDFEHLERDTYSPEDLLRATADYYERGTVSCRVRFADQRAASRFGSLLPWPYHGANEATSLELRGFHVVRRDEHGGYDAWVEIADESADVVEYSLAFNLNEGASTSLPEQVLTTAVAHLTDLDRALTRQRSINVN